MSYEDYEDNEPRTKKTKFRQKARRIDNSPIKRMKRNARQFKFFMEDEKEN